MRVPEQIFLLAIFLAVILIYAGLGDGSNLDNQERLNSANSSRIQEPLQEPRISNNWFNRPKAPTCPTLKSIQLTATDNKGNPDEQGVNYVIILNPKAKELDFKVTVGLSHPIYAKDDKNKIRREYVPKRLYELISDENSTLNGRKPFAAINGDYLDKNYKPQGLNVSRGVEYSGVFKSKRSAFGISGGKPEDRRATIQIGNRYDPSGNIKKDILNYNVIAGNGRFYKNGKFKDICTDLGESCPQATSRSMVATTTKGYVILLVNNAHLEQALYPSMFDDVLQGISKNYCLGRIWEGMLFEGGYSTGLYFDNNLYVQNYHPVGSALLIYKK